MLARRGASTGWAAGTAEAEAAAGEEGGGRQWQEARYGRGCARRRPRSPPHLQRRCCSPALARMCSWPPPTWRVPTPMWIIASPRGLGQFALQHAPPAPDQAQGRLQPRVGLPMWRARPVWPASINAARAAGWPRLAGAWGSLEACSSAETGLRSASWPKPEPPLLPAQALRGALPARPLSGVRVQGRGRGARAARAAHQRGTQPPTLNPQPSTLNPGPNPQP